MPHRSNPTDEALAVSPEAGHKLASFPDFTAVAAISTAEYTSAVAGHLPYSSFNYVSLRCFWPQAQAARFGDGVALILTDPFDQSPFFTVLCKELDSSGGEDFAT